MSLLRTVVRECPGSNSEDPALSSDGVNCGAVSIPVPLCQDPGNGLPNRGKLQDRIANSRVWRIRPGSMRNSFGNLIMQNVLMYPVSADVYRCLGRLFGAFHNRNNVNYPPSSI